MLLGFLIRNAELKKIRNAEKKRSDAKRSSLQGTALGATVLRPMDQEQSGERSPNTAVETAQTAMPVGATLSGQRDLMDSFDRWHDQYNMLAGYCRDEGFESL
jgi:hypothetical protein